MVTRNYSLEGCIYHEKEGAWIWYENGRMHRENDYAYIRESDGLKCWYWNGTLHREDGPAAESPNGSAWFRFNRLHNLNGYAVVNMSTKEWWINGHKYNTQEDFEEARDAYCEKHDIQLSGRLTNPAIPGKRS